MKTRVIAMMMVMILVLSGIAGFAARMTGAPPNRKQQRPVLPRIIRKIRRMMI